MARIRHSDKALFAGGGASTGRSECHDHCSITDRDHLLPTTVPAALTQANPHKPIPFAISAKNNLIAILEKTTLLIRSQRNRFTPIASEFQQTSTSLVLGPGHRTAAQQIARLKIATIACMMGHQLSRASNRDGANCCG